LVADHAAKFVLSFVNGWLDRGDPRFRAMRDPTRLPGTIPAERKSRCLAMASVALCLMPKRPLRRRMGRESTECAQGARKTSAPEALSGREPVGGVNDTNDEFGGVTATADGAPPVLS
jgi:hypothetical protein